MERIEKRGKTTMMMMLIKNINSYNKNIGANKILRISNRKFRKKKVNDIYIHKHAYIYVYLVINSMNYG